MNNIEIKNNNMKNNRNKSMREIRGIIMNVSKI